MEALVEDRQDVVVEVPESWEGCEDAADPENDKVTGRIQKAIASNR